MEAFASLLEDSGSNDHAPLIEVIREQVGLGGEFATSDLSSL